MTPISQEYQSVLLNKCHHGRQWQDCHRTFRLSLIWNLLGPICLTFLQVLIMKFDLLNVDQVRSLGQIFQMLHKSHELSLHDKYNRKREILKHAYIFLCMSLSNFCSCYEKMQFKILLQTNLAFQFVTFSSKFMYVKFSPSFFEILELGTYQVTYVYSRTYDSI